MLHLVNCYNNKTISIVP